MISCLGNEHSHSHISILSHLYESETTFHLTGSRFFGGNSGRSDYDFFAQTSPEVIVELAGLGFKRTTGTYYSDPLVQSVWYQEVANVHVQLVSDVDAKIAVQHLLAGHGKMSAKTKSQKCFAWQIATRAFLAGYSQASRGSFGPERLTMIEGGSHFKGTEDFRGSDFPS